MLDPLTRARLVVALVCLTATPAFAQAQSAAPASDLDAFMAQVLARRDVNRQTLQQYILDDIETFEVLGPGRVPLLRGKREFSWYVRDGLHVRSPVRFDGVSVGEADRAQVRGRLDQAGARPARTAGQADRDDRAGHPARAPRTAGGRRTPVATPRFVSEAYFMDFKFEPGNYYLAGRE